ncbi:hypothetical protein BLOT_009922 [Blomia tropicalis]|nr:hypothetical protein BLOT_009922 [Blomia tropicalis]
MLLRFLHHPASLVSKTNLLNRSIHYKHEKLRSSRINPYKNLFPWNNEVDLAKLLVKNIVYNKHGLIAISKPWGLPIHPSSVNQKPNTMSKIYGDPLFCLHEVLEYVAQLIGVERLNLVKSAHRDWSGLVLLSTSEELVPRIEKSIRRAIASSIPYRRFYCITNGIIQNQNGSERCGIRLFELDEFGDHKEPIYISPEKLTNRAIKQSRRNGDQYGSTGNTRIANVKYRTIAMNRALAVSLVELESSFTKWSFLQCFLAYKASFILGDTFFSARVKHLLGQPVMMKPTKLLTKEEIHRLNQSDHDPLSIEVKRTLNIHHNSEIPLMIHCGGITLPGLIKSLNLHRKGTKSSEDGSELVQVKQNNDLIIESEFPEHFKHTLKRLQLLEE